MPVYRYNNYIGYYIYTGVIVYTADTGQYIHGFTCIIQSTFLK